MDNIIQQLIDLLKSLSPALWQTLVKQAYSEAFYKLLWGIFFGVGVIISSKVYAYGKNDEQEYSAWDEHGWVAIVVGAFLGLASLLCLTSAIQWFINPEFYAVRWLLATVIK
jgi:hypothetical protein